MRTKRISKKRQTQKSHADEAEHTGEKRTYLRDSPLKKKKMYTPAGLFLTSFWSVMCFPFRNTTCDLVSSLVSFIQPQRVRAGADGSCEPGIRQTQVQSGMPLVYNGVCSCQFYRAPRAASKAILQLSCWHETAFRSPHCQVSSAAHFSSLSLRKQNGLSSVR